MNFTREPIIETIITPREGCRLMIRSTKQGSEDEFSVDAVEIVSFGQALFYRSLEKPRPFLVPVGDYEVIEAKESRVVLKNAQYEKTIKIGGGREGSFRKEEEESQVLPVALEDEVAEESEPQQPQGGDRKQRDRHRRRRRRSHEERDEMKQRVEENAKPEASRGEPSAPPSFSHLIPPPTTLISETIHKYKEQQSQEPPVPEAAPKIVEDDSNSISRTALPEVPPLSTNFSPMSNWNNFLP